MDFQAARKLGSLLLLDCPKDALFGIDNQQWHTGPKFKGVKCIPPGAHFAHIALKDEDYMHKIGFFFHTREFSHTKAHSVAHEERAMCVVRQWDPEIQTFVPLPESDESAYQEGVRNFDFDENLGAYPMADHPKWKQLSSLITAETIERIQPLRQIISSSLGPAVEAEAHEELNLSETLDEVDRKIKEQQALQ